MAISFPPIAISLKPRHPRAGASFYAEQTDGYCGRYRGGELKRCGLDREQLEKAPYLAENREPDWSDRAYTARVDEYWVIMP
jgi:hypothetical protein